MHMCPSIYSREYTQDEIRELIQKFYNRFFYKSCIEHITFEFLDQKNVVFPNGIDFEVETDFGAKPEGCPSYKKQIKWELHENHTKVANLTPLDELTRCRLGAGLSYVLQEPLK